MLVLVCEAWLVLVLGLGLGLGLLVLRLMPLHRLLQDIAAADLRANLHPEQQNGCPMHLVVLPEAVHPQCQLHQGPAGMVGE